jgi:hypothetical protein
MLNKFLTVGRSMNLALIILSRSYRCVWVYLDALHRLLQPFGRPSVRARDPGSHSPVQVKNAARRITGRIFYLNLRIIQVIGGDASSVVSFTWRLWPDLAIWRSSSCWVALPSSGRCSSPGMT